MREQFVEIKCDYCHKSKKVKTDSVGHQNDWIEVKLRSQTQGAMTPVRLDFCSVSCLMDYFNAETNLCDSCANRFSCALGTSSSPVRVCYLHRKELVKDLSPEAEHDGVCYDTE